MFHNENNFIRNLLYVKIYAQCQTTMLLNVCIKLLFLRNRCNDMYDTEVLIKYFFCNSVFNKSQLKYVRINS